MKKSVLLLSVILITFSTIFAQAKGADSGRKIKKKPQITFEVTEHDFGTVDQGSDVSFDFMYKNTGKSDLIITNVKKSCGCTIPEWSKAPLKKKKIDMIHVKYDSKRLGVFRKTVTVQSNAENSSVILIIKGKVVKKKEDGSDL